MKSHEKERRVKESEVKLEGIIFRFNQTKFSTHSVSSVSYGQNDSPLLLARGPIGHHFDDGEMHFE